MIGGVNRCAQFAILSLPCRIFPRRRAPSAIDCEVYIQSSSKHKQMIC